MPVAVDDLALPGGKAEAVDAGELLLAHCTVAPSMFDDVELHTHFESGLGIGIRGTFASSSSCPWR